MISVFPLNECSQILWFYCTSQRNKTEKQSSNCSSLVILHWLFGGKKKVLECPHYLSEAFLLRCAEERNRCSWTHGLANARMASSGPVMSLTSEWSLASSGQSYVKWFVHASVGGHTAQEVLTAESCFPRPAAASVTRTHRLLFSKTVVYTLDVECDFGCFKCSACTTANLYCQNSKSEPRFSGYIS